MQKNQLKYSKFLFIGLCLIGLTTIFIKKCKVYTPPCPPTSPCASGPSSAPRCSDDSIFVELPIDIYPQQSTNWCWAASIQMCIKAVLNDSISQCQIATDRVKLCSPSMTASACNCPQTNCIYPLIDYLRTDSCKIFSKPLTKIPCDAHNIMKLILEKYNLTTQIIKIDTPNTLQEIKNNLCVRNPIIAILQGLGSQHIVVIKGYQTIDADTTYLLVNNPLNTKSPSCEGCYHVIPIDTMGHNILSFSDDKKGGTYQPLMYFAVIPKSK